MQRLFKTNKSQASIEDPQTHREHPDPHPHQQQQHQQQPPQPQHQGRQQPYLDPKQQHQLYPQQPSQQHPLTDLHYQGQASDSLSQPQPPVAPPHLARTQSGRTSSIPDVYGNQRPQVTVVPPLSQQNAFIPEGPAPIPGQTTFGQSRQVRTIEDKEHKRSKRSFISSLIKDKSKDEDKQREKEKENGPPERKPLGRSSSVHLLRKSHPPEHSSRDSYSTQTSPQSQHPSRHSTYYPPQPPADASTAPPDQTADQAQYEQYQRAPGQFDSPQSQLTHHSVDYAEDAPHFGPQHDQYHAYHQSESASTSEHYLPYQPQQPRPNNVDSDPYHHLRPPSQASLGPPSPITTPAHPQIAPDSRPSTAATNRYSSQSASQGQQPLQTAMARGDPPNGSIRQQLSQREARSEDQNQYQNQSQADPRVRMSQQAASDQGRSTPPPRSREDISQLDYNQLLQRHEELQAKYSKVKRYYFEREAQVTQLQNTVANQRLSMSKTSLDDAQYTARFERLSQAINNLSFNIRKNWRAIPPWLRHVCNQDAHTVGTKEMTAIGRACITRWLYESIFQHTFHPSIEPSLSAQLKHIEHNLRRGGHAGTLLTDEQRDDLTTKITTWRLTTIEGLQDVLNSQQAEHYAETMNKHYTHQLTESLKANLTDPPPPGLVEGVGMIVGQAIGIASNIPLESREICIEYFMPGTPVNETYMKIEPQIVALTNPGSDERMLQQQAAQAKAQEQARAQEEGDEMSTASTDDAPRDRDVEAEIREAAGKAASQAAQPPGAGGQQGRNESGPGISSQASVKGSGEKHSKKSSFLGGFVNKKPSISARGESRPEVAPSTGNEGEDSRGHVRNSMAVDPTQLAPQPGANEGRIRFAAFVAVEVRGKGPTSNPSAGGANSGKEPGSAATGAVSQPAVNVLFKAPVYEF
ncbi:uncharacterized protein Z520_09516 [Fonsecaea multimorphosa CBS 102226]|uniref:Uncharacterized protein n=1 Tax=Fonsecaea multimorphosa CBS 102226 TaxID=1442371 RepID=A0A0D2ICF2_9EURO|nr:uncharacterized protein Z520_09516 [Fonsecaea multimorphosa CBS 102226]KIX94826.1 hypothetical protein Z520_09516 [Fonsecaea multimorphosa CBS 102226]OAL20404.1 hypothetical protein AYO22_08898 [Fonsecaea multimorphosa]